MRPCALVCSSLLLLVAACSSTPSPQRVQPSIFDVLEQSKQSYADPDRPRSSSELPCGGGAIAICIAENGSVHADKCSCVDRTEAFKALSGGSRY